MDDDLLADVACVSAQGWGFEDLEANRAGRLSKHQARVMRRRLRRVLGVILIFPFGFFALASLAVLGAAVAVREPGLLALWIILLPAAGVFLPLYIVPLVQALGDIKAGAVREVIGASDKGFVYGSFRGAYAIDIMRFARVGTTSMRCYGAFSGDAWREAHRAVREYDWVRAYCLPRSRVLVAAMQGPDLPVGAWYPDPSGRHQWRVFDGAAWTGLVADWGTRQWDPLTQALQPVSEGSASSTS